GLFVRVGQWEEQDNSTPAIWLKLKPKEGNDITYHSKLPSPKASFPQPSGQNIERQEQKDW
ncbi:hypothetical protein CH063_02684, partial [Colletotrichum higginsianum]